MTKFKHGNTFWKYRKGATNPGKYTPTELLEKFHEWLQWVDDNPFYESQIVRYKDFHEVIKVPKIRPLTISGFSAFIGMSGSYLHGIKNSPNQELVDVATFIHDFILNNQYEGAVAGLYQHQIVTRRLGLVDRREEVSDVSSMDEDEVLTEIKRLVGDVKKLADASSRNSPSTIDAQEIDYEEMPTTKKPENTNPRQALRPPATQPFHHHHTPSTPQEDFAPKDDDTTPDASSLLRTV